MVYILQTHSKSKSPFEFYFPEVGFLYMQAQACVCNHCMQLPEFLQNKRHFYVYVKFKLSIKLIWKNSLNNVSHLPITCCSSTSNILKSSCLKDTFELSKYSMKNVTLRVIIICWIWAKLFWWPGDVGLSKICSQLHRQTKTVFSSFCNTVFKISELYNEHE